MSRSFSSGGSRVDFLAAGPALVYPFSIALWCKMGAHVGSCCFAYGSSTAALWVALGQDASARGFFEVSSAGSSDAFGPAGSLPDSDGIWHHVCGVAASATDRRCYVDAVAGTADTANKTVPVTDRMSAGGLWDGDLTPGSYVNADVGYITVWSVALTQAEVSALYNGGVGGNGKNPADVQGDKRAFQWVLRGVTPEVDDITGACYGAPLGSTAAGGTQPPVDPPFPGPIGNVRTRMTTRR